MENVAIYLIKSSGLLLLFFMSYHFLLRKETFFTSNRWYLLAGLGTSILLPFVIFTKVVWVEPSPVNYDWASIPIQSTVAVNHTEYYIYLGLALTYFIGTLVLLTKFGFDFYSLRKILKRKTIQHQADFKFIDVTENMAPFSYFNSIVYNSSLYSTTELENILEHEKIHSEQNHTADVLISRLFCVVFWFNPIVWLYKKAIIQNLEFIADHEALKNITDKKAYQITLLKITTHQNCVAITNHFYQSLIKKRIVMLNKNQSKKRNSWKYALVVPALIGFVVVFQIEVVAQERKQNPKKEQSISKEEDAYQITKSSTEAALKEKAASINTKYGIEIYFTDSKRNADEELTALTVEVKKDKLTKKRTFKSSETIEPFSIVIDKDSDGKLTVNFVEKHPKYESLDIVTNAISPDSTVSKNTQIYINGVKSDKALMDKLSPKEIATVNVNKNNDKQEIRITTKDYSKMFNENTIYINGKKVAQNELELLDQKNIESMNVNTNGKKTIQIITKTNIQTNTQTNNDSEMPVPPTPPVPPVFKNPKAPVFPKAPKAPKGDPINGNKKDWAAFDIKMEEFNKKMETLAPEMEEFNDKMAEFDKQMEPFNAKMEEFNKKMEAYEKQLQEYQAKLKDKK